MSRRRGSPSAAETGAAPRGRPVAFSIRLHPCRSGVDPPRSDARPLWRERAGRALCAGLCLLAAAASADERVLALTPHVVETLYAVGAGDQIVGVVAFSDHPAEARGHPSVGSYRRIATEAALRLEPTLAIAMDPSVSGLSGLRAAGIPVEYSNPRTVEAVIDDIVRLGGLVGRGRPAAQVAEGLRSRLQRLRRRRPNPPIRVFYEIWHDPLTTAGGRSFISDALREIGMANVFDELPLAYTRVSTEAVLRSAPSVVVPAPNPGHASDCERFWRGWLGDDADVAFVTAAHEILERPGPRLIDGMERLQADILKAAAKGGKH